MLRLAAIALLSSVCGPASAVDAEPTRCGAGKIVLEAAPLSACLSDLWSPRYAAASARLYTHPAGVTLTVRMYNHAGYGAGRLSAGLIASLANDRPGEHTGFSSILVDRGRVRINGTAWLWVTRRVGYPGNKSVQRHYIADAGGPAIEVMFSVPVERDAAGRTLAERVSATFRIEESAR